MLNGYDDESLQNPGKGTPMNTRSCCSDYRSSPIGARSSESEPLTASSDSVPDFTSSQRPIICLTRVMEYGNTTKRKYKRRRYKAKKVNPDRIAVCAQVGSSSQKLGATPPYLPNIDGDKQHETARPVSRSSDEQHETLMSKNMATARLTESEIELGNIHSAALMTRTRDSADCDRPSNETSRYDASEELSPTLSEHAQVLETSFHNAVFPERSDVLSTQVLRHYVTTPIAHIRTITPLEGLNQAEIEAMESLSTQNGSPTAVIRFSEARNTTYVADEKSLMSNTPVVPAFDVSLFRVMNTNIDDAVNVIRLDNNSEISNIINDTCTDIIGSNSRVRLTSVGRDTIQNTYGQNTNACSNLNNNPHACHVHRDTDVDDNNNTTDYNTMCYFPERERAKAADQTFTNSTCVKKLIYRSTHFAKMGYYLRNMNYGENFHDVKFEVLPKIFYAHRVALACHSPYFATFFADKVDGKRMLPLEVQIQGITAEAFDVFLNYVYEGIADPLPELIPDVVIAASMFRIPALLDSCYAKVRHLSLETSLRILLRVSSGRFYRIAYNIVLNRFCDVLASANFPLLDVGTVIKILSDDRLNAPSEVLVFNTVLRWIQGADSFRSEYVHQLLACVRFSLMTARELLLCSQTYLFKKYDVNWSRLFQSNWIITVRELNTKDPFQFTKDKPRTPLTQIQVDEDISQPEHRVHFGESDGGVTGLRRAFHRQEGPATQMKFHSEEDKVTPAQSGNMGLNRDTRNKSPSGLGTEYKTVETLECAIRKTGKRPIKQEQLGRGALNNGAYSTAHQNRGDEMNSRSKHYPEAYVPETRTCYPSQMTEYNHFGDHPGAFHHQKELMMPTRSQRNDIAEIRTQIDRKPQAETNQPSRAVETFEGATRETRPITPVLNTHEVSNTLRGQRPNHRDQTYDNRGFGGQQNTLDYHVEPRYHTRNSMPVTSVNEHNRNVIVTPNYRPPKFSQGMAISLRKSTNNEPAFLESRCVTYTHKTTTKVPSKITSKTPSSVVVEETTIKRRSRFTTPATVEEEVIPRMGQDVSPLAAAATREISATKPTPAPTPIMTAAAPPTTSKPTATMTETTIQAIYTKPSEYGRAIGYRQIPGSRLSVPDYDFRERFESRLTQIDQSPIYFRTSQQIPGQDRPAVEQELFNMAAADMAECGYTPWKHHRARALECEDNNQVASGNRGPGMEQREAVLKTAKQREIMLRESLTSKMLSNMEKGVGYDPYGLATGGDLSAWAAGQGPYASAGGHGPHKTPARQSPYTLAGGRDQYMLAGERRPYAREVADIYRMEPKDSSLFDLTLLANTGYTRWTDYRVDTLEQHDKKHGLLAKKRGTSNYPLSASILRKPQQASHEYERRTIALDTRPGAGFPNIPADAASRKLTEIFHQSGLRSADFQEQQGLKEISDYKQQLEPSEIDQSRLTQLREAGLITGTPGYQRKEVLHKQQPTQYQYPDYRERDLHRNVRQVEVKHFTSDGKDMESRKTQQQYQGYRGGDLYSHEQQMELGQRPDYRGTNLYMDVKPEAVRQIPGYEGEEALSRKTSRQFQQTEYRGTDLYREVRPEGVSQIPGYEGEEVLSRKISQQYQQPEYRGTDLYRDVGPGGVTQISGYEGEEALSRKMSEQFPQPEYRGTDLYRDVRPEGVCKTPDNNGEKAWSRKTSQQFQQPEYRGTDLYRDVTPEGVSQIPGYEGEEVLSRKMSQQYQQPQYQGTDLYRDVRPGGVTQISGYEGEEALSRKMSEQFPQFDSQGTDLHGDVRPEGVSKILDYEREKAWSRKTSQQFQQPEYRGTDLYRDVTPEGVSQIPGYEGEAVLSRKMSQQYQQPQYQGTDLYRDVRPEDVTQIPGYEGEEAMSRKTSQQFQQPEYRGMDLYRDVTPEGVTQIPGYEGEEVLSRKMSQQYQQPQYQGTDLYRDVRPEDVTQIPGYEGEEVRSRKMSEQFQQPQYRGMDLYRDVRPEGVSKIPDYEGDKAWSGRTSQQFQQPEYRGTDLYRDVTPEGVSQIPGYEGEEVLSRKMSQPYQQPQYQGTDLYRDVRPGDVTQIPDYESEKAMSRKTSQQFQQPEYRGTDVYRDVTPEGVSQIPGYEGEGALSRKMPPEYQQPEYRCTDVYRDVGVEGVSQIPGYAGEEVLSRKLSQRDQQPEYRDADVYRGVRPEEVSHILGNEGEEALSRKMSQQYQPPAYIDTYLNKELREEGESQIPSDVQEISQPQLCDLESDYYDKLAQASIEGILTQELETQLAMAMKSAQSPEVHFQRRVTLEYYDGIEQILVEGIPLSELRRDSQLSFLRGLFAAGATDSNKLASEILKDSGGRSVVSAEPTRTAEPSGLRTDGEFISKLMLNAVRDEDFESNTLVDLQSFLSTGVAPYRRKKDMQEDRVDTEKDRSQKRDSLEGEYKPETDQISRIGESQAVAQTDSRVKSASLADRSIQLPVVEKPIDKDTLDRNQLQAQKHIDKDERTVVSFEPTRTAEPSGAAWRDSELPSKFLLNARRDEGFDSNTLVDLQSLKSTGVSSRLRGDIEPPEQIEQQQRADIDEGKHPRDDFKRLYVPKESVDYDSGSGKSQEGAASAVSEKPGASRVRSASVIDKSDVVQSFYRRASLNRDTDVDSKIGSLLDIDLLPPDTHKSKAMLEKPIYIDSRSDYRDTLDGLAQPAERFPHTPIAMMPASDVKEEVGPTTDETSEESVVIKGKKISYDETARSTVTRESKKTMEARIEVIKRQTSFKKSDSVPSELVSKSHPKSELKTWNTEQRSDVTSESSMTSEVTAEGQGRGDDLGDLLIIGGHNAQTINYSNESTIYRYSRVHDKWASFVMLPESRLHHAAAKIGHNLFLVGGCGLNDASKPEASTFRFNYDTRKWSTRAPTNVPRMYHRVCSVLGMLYAIGGMNEHGEVVKSVECYHPGKDQWKFTASMSQVRIYPAVAACKEKIFVAGGYGEWDVEESCRPILASAEKYDPRSNQWTSICSLPIARYHSTMVSVRDKIYIIGGAHKSGEDDASLRSLPTLDIYNHKTNKWSHVTDMVTPRHAAGSAVVGDKIYIIGGISCPANRYVQSIEIYDTAKSAWCNEMPFACRSFDCIVLPTS